MKNVVEVQFIGADCAKSYSYYSQIETLEVGDICVVHVVSSHTGKKGEFKTVQVTKVRGLSRAARDRAHKWLVCKVDTEEYFESLQKLELILEIKNKLRERKESANDFRVSFEEVSPEDQSVTMEQWIKDSRKELDKMSGESAVGILIGDVGDGEFVASVCGNVILAAEALYKMLDGNKALTLAMAKVALKQQLMKTSPEKLLEILSSMDSTKPDFKAHDCDNCDAMGECEIEADVRANKKTTVKTPKHASVKTSGGNC